MFCEPVTQIHTSNTASMFQMFNPVVVIWIPISFIQCSPRSHVQYINATGNSTHTYLRTLLHYGASKLLSFTFILGNTSISDGTETTRSKPVSHNVRWALVNTFLPEVPWVAKDFQYSPEPMHALTPQNSEMKCMSPIFTVQRSESIFMIALHISADTERYDITGQTQPRCTRYQLEQIRSWLAASTNLHSAECKGSLFHMKKQLNFLQTSVCIFINS